MSVASVAGPSGPSIAGSVTTPVAAEVDDLLVSPMTVSNPASCLLALQRILGALRESNVASGKVRIAAQDAMSKVELEKASAERIEQIEKEENRTFWDDIGDIFSEIGKWVGAVASSVLAVMSCGAGAPLAGLAVAGAVLSCTSAIDSTAGISKAIFGEEAGGWLNLGMSLGGAICSGGAGVGQLFAKAPEAAKATASAAEATVRTVAGVATVGAGVSTGVGAVVGGVAAGYKRDADLAAANEQEAMNREKRIQRLIDGLTETIKDVISSHERRLERVGAMMTDYNNNNVALVRV